MYVHANWTVTKSDSSVSSCGNMQDFMSHDMTKQTKGVWAQRRLRSAWAAAQSDRVFAVRMKKLWVLSYPLSAQRRLIRLGGCPGWSVFVGRTLISSPVWSTRRAIAVTPVVRVRVPVTLRQFYIQVFQKFISRQPLIRKHLYLDHTYPGGPAFIPYLLTPGLMPRGGARGQNLGHL